MDSLNEVLEKILQEHTGTHAGQQPKEQKQYECPKCKDTGFVEKVDENGYSVSIRCDCHKIRLAKKIMDQSGISAEFRKKTFDNFHALQDTQLANAKKKAMQYVENFCRIENTRYNSILFCGQVGAGKTHLGTAICGALMEQRIAIMYMAYRNAVTKLKQTITDEEGYSREINLYTSARVLYVDDLLKGRLTEADVNILYEIVNYRYMNNMPMIVSTEKSPAELVDFDEAIGSRLIEMCRGNIIQLSGKGLNYRLYGNGGASGG